MARREKLIQRIVRRPPEARFSDVRAIMIEFGWIHARTKGSHESFTKPGYRTFIVKKDSEKVSRAYLDDICTLLELDDQG